MQGSSVGVSGIYLSDASFQSRSRSGLDCTERCLSVPLGAAGIVSNLVWVILYKESKHVGVRVQEPQRHGRTRIGMMNRAKHGWLGAYGKHVGLQRQAWRKLSWVTTLCMIPAVRVVMERPYMLNWEVEGVQWRVCPLSDLQGSEGGQRMRGVAWMGSGVVGALVRSR
jgi:hypothetical protein